MFGRAELDVLDEQLPHRLCQVAWARQGAGEGHANGVIKGPDGRSRVRGTHAHQHGEQTDLAPPLRSSLPPDPLLLLFIEQQQDRFVEGVDRLEATDPGELRRRV